MTANTYATTTEPTLDDLLAEGRAILAAENAKREAEERAQKERIARAWDTFDHDLREVLPGALRHFAIIEDRRDEMPPSEISVKLRVPNLAPIRFRMAYNIHHDRHCLRDTIIDGSGTRHSIKPFASPEPFLLGNEIIWNGDDLIHSNTLPRALAIAEAQYKEAQELAEAHGATIGEEVVRE